MKVKPFAYIKELSGSEVEPIYPFARQGNFTQMDNILFDHIQPRVGLASWSILCAVLRCTRGWHKEKDQISFSQLRARTGIASNATLVRGIKELTDLGIICHEAELGETTTYWLNPRFAIYAVPEPATESVVDTDPYRKCNATLTESVTPPITESVNTKEKDIKKEIKRGPRKERGPRSAAVEYFKFRTGRYPNSLQATQIDASVTDMATLERWKAAMDAWLGKGFSQVNVTGMLDWLKAGIPDNAKPGYKPARRDNGGSYPRDRGASDLTPEEEANIRAELKRIGWQRVNTIHPEVS